MDGTSCVLCMCKLMKLCLKHVQLIYTECHGKHWAAMCLLILHIVPHCGDSKCGSDSNIVAHLVGQAAEVACITLGCQLGRIGRLLMIIGGPGQ